MPKKRNTVLHQIQLDLVAGLGFSWKHKAGIDPLKFLNTYFRGLQPFRLSRNAKALLEPLATTKVTAGWQLSEPPPMVSFAFESADGFNEDTGVAFSRTFVREATGLKVHHDYLSLPEQYRGQGIGKQLLKEWLAQYERMGVRQIEVYATLKDGGYAWARAGFRATKRTEVDRILERARHQLPMEDFQDVKGFYDDHYNNFPTQPFQMEHWARMDFMEPILRGSSWHGEIDLINEFELTNFRDYVSTTR